MLNQYKIIVREIKWVIKIYCCLSIFTFLTFISCKSQTNEEKIQQTTYQLIDILKGNTEEDFLNLIGTDRRQDTELVRFDYIKIKSYINKYLKEDKPEILITNKYTDLGQRLVQVPLYKGYDTIANIKELYLNLYFGPPDIIPLNKISGYALIVIDSTGMKSKKHFPTTWDEE